MTKRDPALEMLAAEAAEYIEAHAYETKWRTLLARLGITNLLEENERLTRAQSFHDGDYVDAIRHFLHDVQDQYPDKLLTVLQRTVGDKVPDDRRDEYPTLAHYLEHGATVAPSAYATPPLPSSIRYLEIERLPDDFYHDLVGQVNATYRYGLYAAQLILLRKLLENLVIDLLRRRYGTAGLALYYDPTKGRFLDFSALLRNLEQKLPDFASIATGLHTPALRKMEKFRQTGNSSAHSIDIHVTKADVDAKRSDATHAVKLLVSSHEKTPIAS